mmetsp:Transcript_45629/g.67292  ORF Transcript_45629/g.67292 Transcript_45629/m.67292 type:complete len:273 (-) Transcript_45629:628-1446(-)
MVPLRKVVQRFLPLCRPRVVRLYRVRGSRQLSSRYPSRRHHAVQPPLRFVLDERVVDLRADPMRTVGILRTGDSFGSASSRYAQSVSEIFELVYRRVQHRDHRLARGDWNCYRIEDVSRFSVLGRCGVEFVHHDAVFGCDEARDTSAGNADCGVCGRDERCGVGGDELCGRRCGGIGARVGHRVCRCAEGGHFFHHGHFGQRSHASQSVFTHGSLHESKGEKTGRRGEAGRQVVQHRAGVSHPGVLLRQHGHRCDFGGVCVWITQCGRRWID